MMNCESKEKMNNTIKIRCGDKRNYEITLRKNEKPFFKKSEYKEQNPYKRRLDVDKPIFEVIKPPRNYKKKKTDYWQTRW